MKLPAFQFYPADWRKDPGVQSLSFHDRGVWFEIVCLMHESEQRGKLMLGGQAMPESALARLLGLDKQNLTNTLTTLFEYGVVSRCEHTGALINRRMIRDEKIRKIRAESGKMGGNPALLNQNSNQRGNQNPKTMLKQKSTPSSSSSTSSSTSIIIKEIPPNPQGGNVAPVFEKSKSRGTLEELKNYAASIGLPESDGESMWHHWEANGWKNGSSPSKNWQSGIQKWKSQGWLPSQKPQSKTNKHAGTTNMKNFTGEEF
jgi:hypothetical protein